MATDMSLSTRLKLANGELDEPPTHDEAEGIVRTPSEPFVWAALGSMAVSALFYATGRKSDAICVGQWAVPLLAMGLLKSLKEA